MPDLPDTALVFGAAPLSIEDVVALARGTRTATLDSTSAFRARIAKGAENGGKHRCLA